MRADQTFRRERESISAGNSRHTALQLDRDTGMYFYDAELLRFRAQTQTDPDARRTDIGALHALARHQGT